jgi:hypothetical protein
MTYTTSQIKPSIERLQAKDRIKALNVDAFSIVSMKYISQVRRIDLII